MEAIDFINKLYLQDIIDDDKYEKYLDTLNTQKNKEKIDHIISTLEDIIRLFKKKAYQEIIDTYVCYSPAGDNTGCDNHFINFSDKEGKKMDIYDMLLSISANVK